MWNKLNCFSEKYNISVSLLLFFILIGFVALGRGFSDAIFPNFYKDAYNINAAQRAFIEFPRELPGVLGVIIITSLSFIGDIKIAILAQIASCIGIFLLGIFTPSFTVMLIFLFINSLGMHVFMPIKDSVGMSLAEKGNVGKRMGQFASLTLFFSVLAGLTVFFGFRFEIFSFKTNFKATFIISAIVYLFATITAIALYYAMKKENIAIKREKNQKFKLFFRKEYKFYYLIAVLCGVQKQIALVFGSWVIIDLLSKGADTMSILIIISSFIGVFFLRIIGNWIDKFGIKKVMYADALSFIIVYVVYGFVVWAIIDNLLPKSGLSLMLVYLVFILDKMSMQFSIVRAVYLKSIALDENEISSVLSTGLSLDHIVSIIAAQISGYIWMTFGAQWVFFIAAFFSLGNLYAAYNIEDKKFINI